MAKKSMCRRNEEKLALVQKYYERRSELKSKIKSAKSFDEVREAQEALLKLPLNASPVRYNRRCNQCGRPHAVYRKFGLCRICLRQQLMTGNVTGGRKSSW